MKNFWLKRAKKKKVAKIADIAMNVLRRRMGIRPFFHPIFRGGKAKRP